MYYIKSDKLYLQNNNTLGIEDNKIFTSYDKAKNYIENSLPINLRGKHFSIINTDHIFNNIYTNNIPNELNILGRNIEGYLSTVNYLLQNENKYSSLLSDVDNNISKVYHYIELNNIPDEKCKEIVSILKELLIKRRGYKYVNQIIHNIKLMGFKREETLLKKLNNLGSNLWSETDE